MAVKRYDGSAWQTVAGLGAQGPAATSSSIATWVKTASGGETSVSGNDDNSQPLSYTVGQELVFINGVLQKRGDDYTATTGNSITGLTALTAGDIVSVWTVNAFSVSNAISNTIVDAKGDILVGTGADTPGRLAVGTNGQVLTAASTTGTGLAWATPAAPSSNWTTLHSGVLNSGTSASFAVSGYDRYIIHFGMYFNTNPVVKWRLNGISTSSYKFSAGLGQSGLGGTVTPYTQDGINLDIFSTFNSLPVGFLELNNCNSGGKPQFFGTWSRANNANTANITMSGILDQNVTVTSIDLVATQTFTDVNYRIWAQ